VANRSPYSSGTPPATVSTVRLAAGLDRSRIGYSACLKCHTAPADRTLTELVRTLADPTACPRGTVDDALMGSTAAKGP